MHRDIETKKDAVADEADEQEGEDEDAEKETGV